MALSGASPAVGEQLGIEPQTLFTSMLAYIQNQRHEAWSEMVRTLNYETLRSSRRQRTTGIASRSCGARDRKSEVGGRKSEVGGGVGCRARDTARPASAKSDATTQGDAATTRPSIRRVARTSRRSRQGVRFAGLLLWQNVQGRSRQGNGQHNPGARLEQYLHAADHQSDRHAGHRRAHDDRRQGLWRAISTKIHEVSEQVAEVLRDVPVPESWFPIRSSARAMWRSRSIARRRPATA